MIRSIDANLPPKLRLWALPILTIILILIDYFSDITTSQITMITAIAIVLAGIPHGTLDIEIAANRFGLSGKLEKLAIIFAYAGCALGMIILWRQVPELALTGFLVISIVHFSADWREGTEPFLAMMVGWALIALPALSHPDAVAAIFEMLTGNQNGNIIAALLTCSAVPATLGSIVFSYWAFKNGDSKNSIDVVSCLVAALFLPPLIAFAVFFCGLHSPRHMRDALQEAGAMSLKSKLAIVVAVTGLSIGLGAILFIGFGTMHLDAAVIRTGFVLLSTLTVPHFIIEHIMSTKKSIALSR